MAVTSGFFDSSDGDRVYNAEQMSSYFDGIVSNGVFESVGGRFAVTPALSGLAVNVSDGRALINCHWVKNDASESVTLTAADIQYPRIDAIALRLDYAEREITIVAKTGTPAANPVMPAIIRTDAGYELYLASVYVPAGATAPGLITDLRPSTYCGWVTGVIQQVSTADLFAQWDAAYKKAFADFEAYMAAEKAAFDSWFAALTGQLVVQTGLVKYNERVQVAAGNTSALMRFSEEEYDADKDILLVFFDGAIKLEGIDYEIKEHRVPVPNRSKWYINLLPYQATFTKNTLVSFISLKNVIGEDVVSVGSGILAGYGAQLSEYGIGTEQEV